MASWRTRNRHAPCRFTGPALSQDYEHLEMNQNLTIVLVALAPAGRPILLGGAPWRDQPQLNPKDGLQPGSLVIDPAQAQVISMPDITGPNSALSAGRPVWGTYRDKTGKLLTAEQFDGDWPFVASPDMRGHEKLCALIRMQVAAIRGEKNQRPT